LARMEDHREEVRERGRASPKSFRGQSLFLGKRGKDRSFAGARLVRRHLVKKGDGFKKNDLGGQRLKRHVGRSTGTGLIHHPRLLDMGRCGGFEQFPRRGEQQQQRRKRK